jgi:hypothetical protein
MKIIRRVYQVKANNQLLVTIPKDSGIKAGDFVEIIKMKIMKAN